MKFLICLLFLLISFNANAATCFWVGGTSDFDNANAASWSSGTGGAGSTCAATGGIPKNAGDVATFDGASGGGTITVCGAAAANCPSASGSLSIAQITCGAFTGTLDFAAIDPNVTLTTAFNCSGTGTRTVNLGDGIWTLSAAGAVVWDLTTVTNLTFNANSSTIDLATTATSNRTFVGGGRTYNIFTITNSASSQWKVRITGSNTFASWAFTNLRWFELAAGVTQTISGAITYNGTSSAQSSLVTDGSTSTISVGSAVALSWLFIQSITKAGAGSIIATNSFDGGNNSGVTITAPTGGARIIGG